VEISYLQKKAKDDPEHYAKFWKAHSKVFKLGYTDFTNLERIAGLMRFNSSANEDAEGLTSFAEYVERAKPDQKEIYYLSGPSREAIESELFEEAEIVMETLEYIDIIIYSIF
jgi:molecular chaperone HtpG